MPQLVSLQNQLKFWASEAPGHQILSLCAPQRRQYNRTRCTDLLNPFVNLAPTMENSHMENAEVNYFIKSFFFPFIFSLAQPNFNLEMAFAALKLHVWWLNILLKKVLCSLSVTVQEWLPWVIILHLKAHLPCFLCLLSLSVRVTLFVFLHQKRPGFNK